MKFFFLVLLLSLLVLCFVDITLEQFILPLVQHKPFPKIEKRGSGEPVPLQGGVSVIGEFYATINVGNPPQTFLVQVDTGRQLNFKKKKKFSFSKVISIYFR